MGGDIGAGLIVMIASAHEGEADTVERAQARRALDGAHAGELFLEIESRENAGPTCKVGRSFPFPGAQVFSRLIGTGVIKGGAMSEPLSSEMRDLLALRLIDGLGPTRIAALVRHFGSARRALQASESGLLSVPGFGPQLSAAVVSSLSTIDVSAEVAKIESAGVDVFAVGGPGYPEWLASIPEVPTLLFIRGKILPTDVRAVALVGTRNPNAYGRRMAKALAEGLARAGVVIVSGLARGVDGIAHRGALDAGGRTLAVLAGGLSSVYPPEHRALAEEVVASGALVTESPMDQEPLKGLFPARNRIISGLSRVVVIVQAPARSGALITAEHGAEHGRVVMAVPGAADDDDSAGCNALIRDGAILCRSVEDVLEELDGVSAVAQREKEQESKATAPAETAGPPAGLDETQWRIWDALGEGQRSIDELAQKLGLTAPILARSLMMLEMKKGVRKLPGNRYERR
jgi:DNA processing protein